MLLFILYSLISSVNSQLFSKMSFFSYFFVLSWTCLRNLIYLFQSKTLFGILCYLISPSSTKILIYYNLVVVWIHIRKLHSQSPKVTCNQVPLKMFLEFGLFFTLYIIRESFCCLNHNYPWMVFSQSKEK